jgi:hypothetical protein
VLRSARVRRVGVPGEPSWDAVRHYRCESDEQEPTDHLRKHCCRDQRVDTSGRLRKPDFDGDRKDRRSTSHARWVDLATESWRGAWHCRGNRSGPAQIRLPCVSGWSLLPRRSSRFVCVDGAHAQVQRRSSALCLGIRNGRRTKDDHSGSGVQRSMNVHTVLSSQVAEVAQRPGTPALIIFLLTAVEGMAAGGTPEPPSLAGGPERPSEAPSAAHC